MKMIDLLKIAAYMLFPAAMFSGCNEDEVGPDYPAPQPVTKIGKAIVEKTSLIASLSTDTTWTVFPGIEATQLRYLAYDGMPQMMFFYEVDLTVENITISQTTPYNENIGAADPEPATRQALHVDAPGFKIWGGSNSDFGSESQKMPQGIFHHNGVCYKSTFNSTPARPRSFFYLTNDKKAYTADASEYEAIAESGVILEACGGVEATDNTTLNVYNIYTAYYLYRLGLKKVTLSVELSVSEIHDFIHRFQAVFGIKPNVEIISYGLVCDMIIKGNILGLKEDDFSYYLEDLRGRRCPVFYHGDKSYILNYQSFLPDEFSSLKDDVSFRYQFFLETKDDIQDIVKKYE